MESVYEKCLAKEFDLRKISYERQKPCPVNYKGQNMEENYRIDFLVNNEVVVEIKSVDVLSKIHEAQLFTYLKLLDCRKGLLLNFNCLILKSGIKRISF